MPFTSSNQPTHRGNPKESSALAQAKQMQRHLSEVAKELTADVTRTKDRGVRSRLASGIAAAARAWCDLEERKRILKMRGLPKNVDAEKLKADKRAARAARRAHEPRFIEDDEQPSEPTAAVG